MKRLLTLLVFSLSFSSLALTPKGETVKKKAVETYAATKAYTIEQKEEFLAALKNEMTELDRDIAVMKAKASTNTDKATAEINSQLANLEKKKIELNAQIDRLSSASKSAWSELRTGVQSALKEMKTSFNKASDKFNETK